MQPITDEYMRQMSLTTKAYSLVLLKAGPKRHEPGVESIIWEHGRRNHALRVEGVLAIVCPINDGSDLSGLALFNAGPDETVRIMDDDPGVQAGVFVYEVHICRGFPGDRLPQ